MSTTTKFAGLLFVGLLAACGGNKEKVSSAAPACPSAVAAPVGTSAAGAVTAATTTTATATTATSKAVARVVEAPRARATKLAVKRLVIARGVAGREPKSPDVLFNAKESKIYAFVEVANPEKAPGEVHVSFLPPSGDAHGDVVLAVGDTARWRTWAFTRQAHEAGEWTAVVRDAQGKELARQSFEVTL